MFSTFSILHAKAYARNVVKDLYLTFEKNFFCVETKSKDSLFAPKFCKGYIESDMPEYVFMNFCWNIVSSISLIRFMDISYE